MTDLLELHGKALGNQYALHALRERRAEMAGEITQIEGRLRHLRSSLVHIDGALALLDPNGDPSTIPAKRPYKRVKLFGQGKLNGMILDALRRAGRPLTTREVRDAIIAEAGFGPEAAKGMDGRVRSNLLYLAKVRGLVRKNGEREGARWTIERPRQPGSELAPEVMCDNGLLGTND